jgi:hypothetical protein
MTWAFRILAGTGILAIAAIAVTVLVDKRRARQQGNKSYNDSDF